MLDMDDYLQIRLLHRDGVSARQIARRLGHGRDTASQIFARLRDEQGYVGQYDQVRRYVARHRKRERETHLFLDHPPGCRLECDFGHIHVDYPQGRELVPVLICVWSYSHYPLAIALPNEKTESILYGLVCALGFFGCVPLELWWDNPTTVASLILKGRDRRLNPHYAALASHYRFAPVPKVKDREELNRHLLRCCLKERNRVVRGRSQSIGEMFQTEQAQAVPLPHRPFDACLQHIRQVDKYQTVLFEEVRYSVPRQVAFEPVVRAIEACQARQMLTAEIIAGKLESFRRSASEGASVDAAASDSSVPSMIPHVHVPPPDLRRFDQLLVHHRLQGDQDHVRDVIEAQPQDAEAADHAGRAHAAVP